jgi:hypothetical protein
MFDKPTLTPAAGQGQKVVMNGLHFSEESAKIIIL